MNTRLLKQLVKLLKEDKTPRKAIGWAGGGVNEIRFLKAMSETTVSSTVQHTGLVWVVCAVQCGASWFVLYNVALHDLYGSHITAVLLSTGTAVRAAEVICQCCSTVSGWDSKPRSKSFFRIAPQNSHLLISVFKVPYTMYCETKWPTNHPSTFRAKGFHSARTARRSTVQRHADTLHLQTVHWAHKQNRNY